MLSDYLAPMNLIYLIYEMDIKIKSLSLSSFDFTSLRQIMHVDVWETIKYFILLVIKLG